MGYYTVDLEDRSENTDLLEEYLLYQQSVKLEKHLKKYDDGNIQQNYMEDRQCKCKCKNEKKEFIKLHRSEFSEKFTSIIQGVLGEYANVKGCAVSADNIDKELITEIIDNVMEKSTQEIKEMEEIITERSQHPTGRYYLVRHLTEALLFNELL